MTNGAMQEDEKNVGADEVQPAATSPRPAHDGLIVGADHNVGLARIEQNRVIPTVGERKVTTPLEWWLYTLFYFSGQGVGIGSYGGSLQQLLLTEQFPDGHLRWGGERQTVAAVVLDLNGILFAVQLVCLLVLGPYADYGTWRPWLTIFFQLLVDITTVVMAGLSRPSQWQAVCALYVIGNLGVNVANTYFLAAVPGLARDLPHMIESERAVLAGTRSPATHVEADMLERSKLYNWVNIVGSFTNLALLAVALGVSYAIGWNTTAETLKSYQVLLGLFGAVTVLCTTPWFIVEKHRPGLQLPPGTRWWAVGPTQIWQAGRHLVDLKQPLLYLVAYFLLQESFGTSFTVVSILQNKIINFSTFDLSGLNLVSYAGGGLGTLICQLVQKKWRIPVKKMLVFGAIMTLGPNIWGVIGAYTDRVGFHHQWDFWLASVWNMMTAAFGSYSVTMISEVVPAPKIYLFLALFNTVGKTSGFIGPFVTSGIVNHTHGNTNIAFWFLLGMGLAGCLLLYFVDPDQAKIDSARFLEKEARDLYQIPMQNEKEVVIQEEHQVAEL